MTITERARNSGDGLRAVLCAIWKLLAGLNRDAAKSW
jgi:hypothetical protein